MLQLALANKQVAITQLTLNYDTRYDTQKRLSKTMYPH